MRWRPSFFAARGLPATLGRELGAALRRRVSVPVLDELAIRHLERAARRLRVGQLAAELLEAEIRPVLEQGAPCRERRVGDPDGVLTALRPPSRAEQELAPIASGAEAEVLEVEVTRRRRGWFCGRSGVWIGHEIASRHSGARGGTLMAHAASV